MNPPELIRKHGDYLERAYADQILSKLHGYALFWVSYIGNDSSSQYLPMPNVSEEAIQTRTRIWEHLYTLLESFALCWRLVERFEQLQPIQNAADYADNLNHWIAFYAHFGRIHDMAEKVANEFKDYKGEGLFTPFDQFNELRHTVLHYPKTPMKWVDNVILAPWIGEADGNWKQGMRWSEATPDDFDYIATTSAKVLRELEAVANGFLYRIANLAKEQKGFRDVVWSSLSPTERIVSPPSSSFGSGTSELNFPHPSGFHRG